MVNREIQATWYYHNGTKHRHGNLMDPRHSFDPSSQPLLFKIYPDLDPLPLPFEASPSVVPALSAISMEVIPSVSDGTLDITTLSSHQQRWVSHLRVTGRRLDCVLGRSLDGDSSVIPEPVPNRPDLPGDWGQLTSTRSNDEQRKEDEPEGRHRSSQSSGKDDGGPSSDETGARPLCTQFPVVLPRETPGTQGRNNGRARCRTPQS